MPSRKSSYKRTASKPAKKKAAPKRKASRKPAKKKAAPKRKASSKLTKKKAAPKRKAFGKPTKKKAAKRKASRIIRCRPITVKKRPLPPHEDIDKNND